MLTRRGLCLGSRARWSRSRQSRPLERSHWPRKCRNRERALMASPSSAGLGRHRVRNASCDNNHLASLSDAAGVEGARAATALPWRDPSSNHDTTCVGTVVTGTGGLQVAMAQAMGDVGSRWMMPRIDEIFGVLTTSWTQFVGRHRQNLRRGSKVPLQINPTGWYINVATYEVHSTEYCKTACSY